MASSSSARKSSASGILMFIPSENKIVRETVLKFCTEPDKREPLDLRISDFDGVRYQLVTTMEDRSVLSVNLAVPFFASIPSKAVTDFMSKRFGSMVASPSSTEFDVALTIVAPEGEEMPDGADVAERVSKLGVDVVGCMFRPALEAIASGGRATDGLGERLQVEYRPREAVWVVPRVDRLTVVWSLEFSDVFDGALARVICSEMPEAGRRVAASPPTAFHETTAPPSEVTGSTVRLGPNGVGFVSMSLLQGNVDSPAKLERAVHRLALFRAYLLYHIKAAKAALHARMRHRVASWLRVLRRASPDSEKAASTLRKGIAVAVAVS